MLQQLLGPGSQFGPELQSAAQIRCRQREFLGADEVQVGVNRRGAVPELPRRKEVESGTKPGFSDTEAGSGWQGPPAFLQLVVTQIDVTALFQAVMAGVVDVAEANGNGLTLFGPAQLR